MEWLRPTAVLLCWALIGSAVRADPSSSWRGVLRDGVTAPPWPRRLPPTPTRPWAGLSALDNWPAEPASPRLIERDRLGRALAQLCGNISEDRAARYAGWVLDGSLLRGTDPFLVGALIFTSSRCDPGHEDKLGVGLAGLSQTQLGDLRNGRLHYWVPDEAGWQPRELVVDSFRFTPRALLDPEANLYFTAALLQVQKLQCGALDSVVRGERHRHFISHFLWGDRVLGSYFEDRVLQERRRLLRLYHGGHPQALTSFRNVPLCSPLDGVPRVLSSRFHDPRPDGRRHGGIDFFSSHGEPVRAVADGVVTFAGLAYRRGAAENLTPAQARHASRRGMGIGGLFVLIDHGNQLTSGCFHLASYSVQRDEKVRAGQIIGRVGNTGTKDSPSHLHFELRVHDHNIDPARPLKPYLVPRARPTPVARHEI